MLYCYSLFRILKNIIERTKSTQGVTVAKVRVVMSRLAMPDVAIRKHQNNKIVLRRAIVCLTRLQKKSARREDVMIDEKNLVVGIDRDHLRQQETTRDGTQSRGIPERAVSTLLRIIKINIQLPHDREKVVANAPKETPDRQLRLAVRVAGTEGIIANSEGGKITSRVIDHRDLVLETQIEPQLQETTSSPKRSPNNLSHQGNRLLQRSSWEA